MQEPGANGTEILDGIRYVRPGGNFESKVTQFFKKIDVNGYLQHDLYAYLKGACEPTFQTFSLRNRLFYDPLQVGDIAWNFEKFLIGRDGKPMFRYHPHLIDHEHLDMNQDLQVSLASPNPFSEEQTAEKPTVPNSIDSFFKSLDTEGISESTQTKVPIGGEIVVNEALGN